MSKRVFKWRSCMDDGNMDIRWMFLQATAYMNYRIMKRSWDRVVRIVKDFGLPRAMVFRYYSNTGLRNIPWIRRIYLWYVRYSSNDIMTNTSRINRQARHKRLFPSIKQSKYTMSLDISLGSSSFYAVYLANTRPTFPSSPFQSTSKHAQYSTFQMQTSNPKLLAMKTR